nr:unnamed protein product [Callosobruchus chinensis]CAH7716314.1 unnamed protein product [Callosobruchus chinensis]
MRTVRITGSSRTPGGPAGVTRGTSRSPGIRTTCAELPRKLAIL